MRHLATLNESSINRQSSDLSRCSDFELLREVYHRSQTDHVSRVSSHINSVSMLGLTKHFKIKAKRKRIFIKKRYTEIKEK